MIYLLLSYVCIVLHYLVFYILARYCNIMDNNNMHEYYSRVRVVLYAYYAY